MRIAVLAWGSLLWSPRELAVVEGPWNEDGPYLPIEFSRIASDGRLTLVIDPKFDSVQVYWKIMDIPELESARKNLQLREKADSIDEIGFVSLLDNAYCIRHDIVFLTDGLLKWTAKKGLDATIWTDLKPKFFEKTGKPFTQENARIYLDGLQGKTRERACEYIVKAPEKTQTRLRSILEASVK